MLIKKESLQKKKKKFSIDFHYTWIEVTPDITINFN